VKNTFFLFHISELNQFQNPEILEAAIWLKVEIEENVNENYVNQF
jgi:hypothetical protein